MTVHASKGLEFRVVMVVGVEDSMLPYAKSVNEGNEAEERRLLYVAMSRAKDHLQLSYCDWRRPWGGSTARCPSR